jgi:hypothetical protein
VATADDRGWVISTSRVEAFAKVCHVIEQPEETRIMIRTVHFKFQLSNFKLQASLPMIAAVDPTVMQPDDWQIPQLERLMAQASHSAVLSESPESSSEALLSEAVAKPSASAGMIWINGDNPLESHLDFTKTSQSSQSWHRIMT